MTFTIQAVPVRRNVFGVFTSQRDKLLLDLFKRGWHLNVWRGKDPTKVFLSNPLNVDDDEYLISGSRLSKANAMETHCSVAHFKAIGRLVSNDTHGVVTHAMSRLRLGLPMLEVYAYDPDRAAVIEQEWSEVQAALALQAKRVYPQELADLSVRATRNREGGERTPDGFALALLKYMLTPPEGTTFKRRTAYPYAELLEPLQELDRLGIVELASNNVDVWFRVRKPYHDVNLRHIRRLDVKYQKPQVLA